MIENIHSQLSLGQFTRTVIITIFENDTFNLFDVKRNVFWNTQGTLSNYDLTLGASSSIELHWTQILSGAKILTLKVPVNET